MRLHGAYRRATLLTTATLFGIAMLLWLVLSGSQASGAPVPAFAYIGDTLGGTVSVVDLSTNSVVATIPVGPAGAQPWGTTMLPDGSFAYVAISGGYPTAALR